MRPTVLTIAGSDSSGGAGIQADLKTIEACGGWGASAVTAVTVQGSRGVLRTFALPFDLVRDQIDAALGDLDVAAVKSGMLASVGIVHAVAAALREAAPRPFVLDPVMVSWSGHPLLPEACLGPLAEDLLPIATLVTPNIPEACALTGLEIASVAQAERAARRLLERGARAVLVKGGHLAAEPGTDVLVTPAGSRVYRGGLIDTPHTHGTGCVLSAAVATRLALGQALEEAVGAAKEFVRQAIRHGLVRAGGRGPVDPLFSLHPAAGR